MPGIQQEKLSPGGYRVRHVAPLSPDNIQPGITKPVLSPGVAVLRQTLYAKYLPQSPLPNSPDLESGEAIMRLGDAGEFTLRFPNRDASDGQPWRSRFDPKQRLHWVEIYHEGDLEFVGVLADLQLDRQSVQLKGYDGTFCLKSAYEQDFQTIMAPRDFIERYTGVWTTVVADNFASLNGATWSTSGAGVSFTPNQYGLVIQDNVGVTATLKTQSGVVNIPTDNQPWRATVTLQTGTFAANNNTVFGVGLAAGAALFQISYLNTQGTVTLSNVASSISRSITMQTVPLGYPQSLTLECDGRWVRGYINGVLIGYVPTIHNTIGQLFLQMTPASTGTVTVGPIALRTLSPFLMKGTDKGDYVLPGNQNTYPVGGLHGRFYNDADIANDSNYSTKILAPDRTTYAERQDGPIGNASVPPQPGAAPGGTNWSVAWFGAVYLKLSAGNYTFTLGGGTGNSCVFRLWVGKTGAPFFGSAGSPLLLQANFAAFTSVSTTMVASNYAGTNSDGSTSVKDGWYPIIIEFAAGSTTTSPTLSFTPPASYTDPGGTALTGGNSVFIPQSSLSPLGCVDQRVQGQSHFDLVQKTAVDFGYQMACKPRALEQTEFPGVYAPRLREGVDSDEIIETDDLDRKSGVNNYTNDLDATDNTASLRAFGSGIADGKGAQVAFEAQDPPTMTSALFDMQAWVDAGDVAFPSLLVARAQTEMGLRLSPWQNLAGDPIARDRLSDTFPLTGALAQFRWRPGDGARVWLPDVAVQDTAPRPMRQVTRQFVSTGRTGTQVQFRSRPRDVAYSIREQLKKNAAALRNFHNQYLTLEGVILNFVTVGPGATPEVSVMLHQGDLVVTSELLISENSASQELRLLIGGVDQTSNLGLSSGWTLAPVRANILSVTTVGGGGSANKIFAQIKNNSGVNSTAVTACIRCTVLRRFY